MEASRILMRSLGACALVVVLLSACCARRRQRACRIERGSGQPCERMVVRSLPVDSLPAAAEAVDDDTDVRAVMGYYVSEASTDEKGRRTGEWGLGLDDKGLATYDWKPNAMSSGIRDWKGKYRRLGDRVILYDLDHAFTDVEVPEQEYRVSTSASGERELIPDPENWAAFRKRLTFFPGSNVRQPHQSDYVPDP